MNTDITLSILITTYNRVAFLETTVSRFISQILKEDASDRVELVIGNDASSDGTEEFLNRLAGEYPFVKVLNHKKNLGLSGNVEKIVALSRGEYIWHFGDDDLITDGAVKKILASIYTHSPNYILINTVNIESLDERNLDYKIIGERRLDIQTDMFVQNFTAEADDVRKIHGWLYLTGLLSAVACKKKLFVDLMVEAKKHVRADNVYLYQTPIIIGISQFGELYLIASPLVLHRKNENNWTNAVSKILQVNLYDASEVVRVVKEYMPGEYKEYQKRFAAFVLATLLDAKKKRVNVTAYIFDALRKNYNCYPYNIRFAFLLFLPAALVRVFLK